MIHRRARLAVLSSTGILLSLALAFSAARAAAAQPVYRWTTLAGRASIGSEDGARTEARFNQPHSLAFDPAGNLYVADTGNHTIRRISPAGVVSTFAGKPGEPGAADGTGASARFRSPEGLAVDRNGNVYVADTGNHTIRLITPSGIVSTIAGSPGQAGTVDGPAATARFDSPDRLTVDQLGNVYLSNHGVRKISAGTVTTLSIPAQVSDPDGRTLVVRLERCPAVDADGNLYFATINLGANLIITRAEQYLKIRPSGAASVVRSSYYGTDNSGSFYAWRFHENTLFSDYAGRLFAAIEFRANFYLRAFRVVRMQSDGALQTSNVLDLRSHLGQPVRPRGLAQDAAGNWYFTCPTDSAIRSSSGVFGGTALSPGAVDGQGGSARFDSAVQLAVDRSSNVWISESVPRYQDTQVDPRFSYATRVRKITSSGLVTTPPQPASWSQFFGFDYDRSPSGIWVDQSGTVTLARLEDSLSLDFRLNQIFAAGSITEMSGPRGYAFDPIGDSVGNLYALNYTNVFISSDPPPPYFRIVRREANGTWFTLAGGPSNEIVDGTGTTARFKSPGNLTLDRANNLHLIDRAETDASYIRKITNAGVVTTVSGKLLRPPTSLAVGAAATYFLTYADANIITRLDADGIETVIGGTRDVSGSSDGTGALFTNPRSIAIDAHDTLYVIDGEGTTVRKGEFLGYAPEITTQPASAATSAGGSVSFTVTATSSSALTYQWHLNGTALVGATSSTLNLTNLRALDAGDYTVVVSNGAGSVTSNKATLTVNTPTTPAPSPSGTGGGGGGAPSDWFAACVASALLIRAWRQRGR